MAQASDGLGLQIRMGDSAAVRDNAELVMSR